VHLPVVLGMRRATPSSDLTFDSEGYLLILDGRGVTRLAYGATPQMLIPDAVFSRRVDGLLALPNGDVLIADYDNDELLRLNANGARRRFNTIVGPGKFARGPGDSLYVTGYNGELFRVDPNNGRATSLARIFGRLGGLAFSVDYKTLFASDNRNGDLLAFKLRPDGTVDQTPARVRGLGQGPAGLATDICDNVYVADDSGGPVLRVTPTGQIEKVTSGGDFTRLSALAFGSGKQGWDDRTLFAVSADRGGLYELKLGVRAAPPPPAAAAP
jgi:hypothetical protein